MYTTHTKYIIRFIWANGMEYKQDNWDKEEITH